MKTQNFENHSTLRSTTRTQMFFYTCVILLNILAIINLYRILSEENSRLSAILFMLTGVTLLVSYFMFRSFSIKAQDRAIRAEENLRHFVLTGKLLDKDLKITQIVALRFASDAEFIGLAERAARENLSNTDIKKAIKNWRADNHRA